MTRNPIIAQLPKHLKGFIIDQNYDRYTAQDHAVWRYVMRQNVQYLGKVAHRSYLDGLARTGISIDKIPSLDEMNEILLKIGWAAVTVDGFIPPAAFMEFQKYNVLVIAADIRPYDQIEYTPAPDIIHEAAGHAPIIADAEYAAYLKYFGEIGCKAFSSKKDYEIYEAIRHLSILKADPYTPAASIEEAERRLDELSGDAGMPSEMSLIRNLHWWTVEYGLIGELDNPKIYGAGLLSSIGESKGALSEKVIKLPYTIEAMDYNFDITKPQPQLFVTPDFNNLTSVLDEFANRMALRTGGMEGILKAIASGNTATLVYSSGLQVSGTFTEVISHHGMPAYIRTEGPTTLNFRDRMIEGHSPAHHAHGFGAPIGKIKGCLKPMHVITQNDLKKLGIETGRKCTFEFESGVKVEGVLDTLTRKEGSLLILTFKDCIVKYRDRMLFEPSWGVYDMAVGEKIISTFSGPADAEGFGLHYEAPEEKTHHIDYDAAARELHHLYDMTRGIRKAEIKSGELKKIWDKVKVEFPDDWLLPVEIYEIATQQNINGGFPEEVMGHLDKIKQKHPELEKLITNGLDLTKDA